MAYTIPCQLMADKDNKPQLHFRQTILLNGKVVTKAVFSGTCVKATGGRPYLPEGLLDRLGEVEKWDGEL